MASPTLDGNATGKSTNANATVSLTTTLSNDIIVVMAYNEAASGGGVAVSSVTAAGLTFTQRSISNASTHGSLEVWWAPSTGILTAETITVAWSGTFDDSAILAFGVNGCNLTNPWDGNGALPAKASFNGTGTPSVTGVSTTSSSDHLISGSGNVFGTLSMPSGWTTPIQIGNGGGANGASIWASTLAVSSPQSGQTVTWSGSTFGNGGETIVDALKSGTNPLTWNPSAAGTNFSFTSPTWETAPDLLALTSTASYNSVLGNVSQSTGKFYWEATLVGNTPSQSLIGLGNASTGLSSYLGNDSNSFGLQDNGTVINAAGTSGWANGLMVPGARIGMAVDVGAKKFWLRVNGGAWLSGDPVAGTGGGTYTLSGAVFPACAMNAGGPPTGWLFISGSTHNFAGAVPSGFSSWGDPSSFASPTQTFDPNFTEQTTLTNGNLTAAFQAGDGVHWRDQSACGRITSVNTYMEITLNTAVSPTGGDAVVGIVPLLSPIWSHPGQVVNSGLGWDNSGSTYLESVTTMSQPTFAVGDVMCIAVNPTSKKAWFRKNGGSWFGGASPNPATNSGGFDLTALFALSGAVVPAVSGFTNAPQFTLNAAGPFTFSNPFVGGAAPVSFFHSTFSMLSPQLLLAAAGLEIVSRNPLLTRRGLILPF